MWIRIPSVHIGRIRIRFRSESGPDPQHCCGGVNVGRNTSLEPLLKDVYFGTEPRIGTSCPSLNLNWYGTLTINTKQGFQYPPCSVFSSLTFPASYPPPLPRPPYIKALSAISHAALAKLRSMQVYPALPELGDWRWRLCGPPSQNCRGRRPRARHRRPRQQGLQARMFFSENKRGFIYWNIFLLPTVQ